MASKKLMTDRERFFKRIKKLKNGCWEWQLAKDRYGYGAFKVGSILNKSRRSVKAHRWAYEEFVGSVPKALQLDHLCRNRACANPRHLEAVTGKENVRRGINYHKSHCINGHAMTEDNIYVQLKRGYPFRACRVCRRLAQKQYRKRVGPDKMYKIYLKWKRKVRNRAA